MKTFIKNKTKINLIIDAIMLVVLMAISGLGFLIKFVLLPGFKRNEIYNDDIELYFLGFTRHQWGSIHLYLAFFFLSLLALHLILHWGAIVHIFRQIVTGKKARLVISIFVGILSISLALAPFYINPDIKPLPRKYMHSHISDPVKSADPENKQEGDLNNEEQPISSTQVKIEEEYLNPHQHSNNEININGTMTLNEISGQYNLSVSELAEVISVPPQYANERLGRLKKRYTFEIDDLRSFIKTKSEVNDK